MARLCSLVVFLLLISDSTLAESFKSSSRPTPSSSNLDNSEKKRWADQLYFQSANHVDGDSTVGNASSLSKKVLARVPNVTLKRGIEKYLQILGLNSYTDDGDVGVANHGLEKYFSEQRANNPCFDSLVREFESRLEGVKRKRNVIDKVARQNEWPLKGRPSLENVCGKRNDDDLNPGWAWSMALKLANGDPNLAMSIIGSLGHDDIGMRDSPLFIPQSLGEDVDISEGMKARIVEIQASSSKDPRVIPSKYYHVIGAAFMSCQLIQQGVDKATARSIESNASRMYRGVRLCAHGLESKVNQFENLVRLFVPKGALPTHSEEIILNNVIRIIRSRECDQSKPSIYNTTCRQLSSVLPGLFESEFLNTETGKKVTRTTEEMIARAKDAIRNFVAKSVAESVFNREYLGNEKINGVRIPCTNIQNGVALFDKIKNGFDKPFYNDRSCGVHYSDATCQRAREILKTWMIDFDWTIEQHDVGAKFGADKCNELKKGEDPYAKSCEALVANNISLPSGQKVSPKADSREKTPEINTSEEQKIE